MDIALYALGVLALAAGVAGVVLPALPGAPLLLGGAVLVAWAGDFARIGWVVLVVVGVLSALIVAVDWLAGLLGAKLFGASRWAMVGAGLGVLAGLFFGLPGVVLGPAVGAVVLESLKNPDFGRAARAGLGVFVGFVVGSAVKAALAFTIVGLVVVALLV